MAQIVLDVLSMDAAPLPAARSCRFEGNGGTIGRDESNTLVLTDKHRRVSRLHAAVAFSSGQAVITNASTSLPITVGDVLLDCGKTMPLNPGVLVEIGPYVLRVQAAAAAGPDLHRTAVPPPSPVAAAPIQHASAPVQPVGAVDWSIPVTPAAPVGANPASADPFADLLSGIGGAAPSAASADPFSGLGMAPPPAASAAYSPAMSSPPMDDPLAGLFDPVPPRPVAPAISHISPGVGMDPFAALGLGGPAAASVPNPSPARSPQAPMAVIPEDFNPFEMPSQSVRNQADPLSSMLGGMAPASGAAMIQGEPAIDSLFNVSPGAAPSDSFFSGMPSASGSQAGLDALLANSNDSDPLALFGESPSRSDAMMRPMRDDLAEVAGAYQPPRALDAAVPPPRESAFAPISPSAAPFAAPPVGAGADALTRAFLQGANLHPSVLPQGLTPELMTVIGSLLRSATAGAVDMLAARAATKLEVQANVTIISAQANNPLKFLPNGDTALQQLLSKRMPGFMAPDEAMKDAFDDLRAHEIGVIAGTRAALAEVLGRFDPEVLGERLTGGSFLESLLPSVRKTKLWDIYLERYTQIRREAEDDFQSIFGRAFVQAYERETTRMKAKKTGLAG